MQYPVDYLKKESAHSEVEQVAWQQKSILKRFKRSGDDLGLPEGFGIGEAVTDGNCFFDSFRQGLEQQLGIRITVEQLRNDCEEFARDNPPEWFISAIANSHDNSGRVRSETLGSYIENIPNNNRWGDPDIEGRILCQKYNVKLHIAERQPTAGWIHQIIDKISSKSIDNADYRDCSIIHIINEGRSHFVPIKRLTNSLSEDPQRKKVKPSESEPQDFELIELLIQKPAEIGMRTPPRFSSGLDVSFEKRFQSFIDQISSYLHSVEKEGFFPHFFLGSFSTLLDTQIAEKLNVKKVYFRFDTAETLRVFVIRNDQIRSAEDAIHNISLFSISEEDEKKGKKDENKNGLPFTSGELGKILQENIGSEGLTDQGIEDIKKRFKDRVESRLVLISKKKEGGISVEMKDEKILDSDASHELSEIKKEEEIWKDPENEAKGKPEDYIAELASPDIQTVEKSSKKVFKNIYKIYSKYENSLSYAQGAREAAHHGFVAGVFMNFHYRYNLKIYLEKFVGRGYADIVLLARGPDRSFRSILIVVEMKSVVYKLL
ncbi:hypothetical protein [Wolbachia endosymbiont (group A) of Pipizella viduata]|uniref:hypothetical protein n=1 Tax=Wolbachia endosymbiont (group A) of Pipizella viduata TaxID=3066154 RepID=UPI00333E698B